MNKKRKILILTITAVVLVATVLIPVFVINKKDEPVQTETETTTETTAEELTERPKAKIYFNRTTGELTVVSSQFNSLFSSDLPDDADLCDLVKVVIIEDGIKHIGVGAFENFFNLEKVVLPSSVNIIDEGAFRNCSSLKEINLENVAEIEREAFLNCSSIESIVLSEKLCSLSSKAFGDCTSLKYITLNNPETLFYSSFEGCTAIQEVTAKYGIRYTQINEFKGSPFYEKQTEYFEGITYYGNEIVDMNPEYKGVCHIKEGVKAVSQGDFEQNTGITEIVLPDSVETVEWYPFLKCEGLKKISFGKGVREFIFNPMNGFPPTVEEYYVDPNNEYFSNDKYGVLFNKDKTILYAYPASNQRTEYTIPDSVKSIEFAFYFCDYLKTVTVGKAVSDINNCMFFTEYLGEFTTCKNLEKLFVSKDNPNYSSDKNGILYDKNKKTLILVPPACKIAEYNIPDSVTTIVSGAFYKALGIEKIYIGTNVKTLENYSLCDVNREGNFIVYSKIYYAGTEKQWKTLSEGTTEGRYNYPEVYFNCKPFAEATTVPTTAKKPTNYKEAYNQYLKNYNGGEYGENFRFELVYFNNDDIPELFVSEENAHIGSVKILTYTNGKVVQIYEGGRYGTLNYIERNSIVVESDLHQGIVYGCVKRINDDGSVEELFSHTDNSGAVPEGSDDVYYKIGDENVSKFIYEMEVFRRMPEDTLVFCDGIPMTTENIDKYCK